MRADLFRLENIELRAAVFPGPGESYPPGAFARLFAAINEEDIFTHWYQQKGHRANFDSDVMHFELDTRTLEIGVDLASFSTFPAAKERICRLVDQVGDSMSDYIDFVVPQRFFIWGTWPLEPGVEDKDVGAILKREALELRDGHFALLPGEVEGAAIELVGHDNDTRWIVKVAPYLSEPDHLYLSAELRFDLPDEPPDRHSNLIGSGLDRSYEFLLQKVVPFAGSFMP